MGNDTSWLDDRPPRLGDLVDDHCPRCKRLMNHAIASFVGDKIAKVVCQTCHSEHPYLEGKERKKVSKSAATAFDQVLAKVSAPATPPAASAGKKAKAQPRARPLYRHKATPPGKK